MLLRTEQILRFLVLCLLLKKMMHVVTVLPLLLFKTKSIILTSSIYTVCFLMYYYIWTCMNYRKSWTYKYKYLMFTFILGLPRRRQYSTWTTWAHRWTSRSLFLKKIILVLQNKRQWELSETSYHFLRSQYPLCAKL